MQIVVSREEIAVIEVRIIGEQIVVEEPFVAVIASVQIAVIEEKFVEEQYFVPD